MTTDYKSIMLLSPLQVWFASCFAFKLQFTDVRAYLNKIEVCEDSDYKTIVDGNLQKRVVDWHNEICGVMTNGFIHHHTPAFVQAVIENFSLAEPSKDPGAELVIIPDPFTLHVALLVKASEMMIWCLAEAEVELSSGAVLLIKNWFELLQVDQFDIFLQCSNDYATLKKDLSALVFNYDEAIANMTNAHGRVGDFFDPNALFLYLTHAVFMESYKPSFTWIDDNCKHQKTEGQNDMIHTRVWQKASGSFLQWRYSIKEFKGMTGSKKSPPFPFLGELNRITLHVETAMEKKEVPPVHVIHVQILHKMILNLKEKAQQGWITIEESERGQFSLLDVMLSQLQTSTQLQLDKLFEREKRFRSDIKTGKQQGFRISRQFNNDLFLMGPSSFGVIIIDATTGSQKKKKSLDDSPRKRKKIQLDELENMF